MSKSPAPTAADKGVHRVTAPQKPPKESAPRPPQVSPADAAEPFRLLTAAKFLTMGAKESEPNQSHRLRDLLPLPVPANEGIEFTGSRCVKRRLLCGSHASGIVRDSVVALNTLSVGSDSADRANPQPLTAAQEDVMASLKLSAQRLGAPPEDMHAREP